MQKLVFILVVVLCVVSCKKEPLAPEGPTDIRIFNSSDQTYSNVTVNTTNIQGAEFNFGTIAPQSYSEYHRFDKAFNKAEITLTINNEIFTTGPVDLTYLVYLSTVKATYLVWISDFTRKKIEIYDVILESDL